MLISKDEIAHGTSTKFWQAVMAWVDEELVAVHLELEDPHDITEYGTFKRLAGVANALKRFKTLPAIIEEYTNSNPENERS